MVVLASGSSEVAKLAADAWWLLLGDTPELSEEVSAKIKLLYPQKLFGLALPKIKAVVDGKDKRCAGNNNNNDTDNNNSNNNKNNYNNYKRVDKGEHAIGARSFVVIGAERSAVT